MAHWLNANAAAIQAIGSVATVLLTAVLASITWRYVKLTQRLVTAQMGEAASRRRDLRTQLEVVSAFLHAFPSQDDPRLSEAILSPFNDLREFSGNHFRTLVSEVSVEAGRHEAVLEEHVTWLINLVREIRSVPRGIGYNWSNFPSEDYERRLRSARDAFQRLSAELDARERELSDGGAR
jgi:hypothetical protein